MTEKESQLLRYQIALDNLSYQEALLKVKLKKEQSYPFNEKFRFDSWVTQAMLDEIKELKEATYQLIEKWS